MYTILLHFDLNVNLRGSSAHVMSDSNKGLYKPVTSGRNNGEKSTNCVCDKNSMVGSTLQSLWIQYMGGESHVATLPSNIAIIFLFFH